MVMGVVFIGGMVIYMLVEKMLWYFLLCWWLLIRMKLCGLYRFLIWVIVLMFLNVGIIML